MTCSVTSRRIRMSHSESDTPVHLLKPTAVSWVVGIREDDSDAANGSGRVMVAAAAYSCVELTALMTPH